MLEFGTHDIIAGLLSSEFDALVDHAVAATTLVPRPVRIIVVAGSVGIIITTSLIPRPIASSGVTRAVAVVVVIVVGHCG